MTFRLLLIAVLGTSACAGQLRPAALDAAQKKARFDLSCDTIEVQEISHAIVGFDDVFEVGARGCGKTETYAVACQPAPTTCRFIEDRVRTRETHVLQNQ